MAAPLVTMTIRRWLNSAGAEIARECSVRQNGKLLTRFDDYPEAERWAMTSGYHVHGRIRFRTHRPNIRNGRLVAQESA